MASWILSTMMTSNIESVFARCAAYPVSSPCKRRNDAGSAKAMNVASAGAEGRAHQRCGTRTHGGRYGRAPSRLLDRLVPRAPADTSAQIGSCGLQLRSPASGLPGLISAEVSVDRPLGRLNDQRRAAVGGRIRINRKLSLRHCPANFPGSQHCPLIKNTRQEVRNFTVMAMRPRLLPAEVQLAKNHGTASARAEVKLRQRFLDSRC